MIQKKIHYCWFGNNEKSNLIKACIKTWEMYMPEWEIKLWNEENSPMDHPFIKKAMREKKYAFVADYVRCYALYSEGGVYLDTDMEIIKDISPLLKYDFFSAYEDSDTNKISCGVIGAIKEHELMEKMLQHYDENNNYYELIPQILGRKYKECNKINSKILSSDSFYPYNPFDSKKLVKQFMYSHITPNTYGIHHWGYSWKFSFYEKLLNKLRKIYNIKYING